MFTSAIAKSISLTESNSSVNMTLSNNMSFDLTPLLLMFLMHCSWAYWIKCCCWSFSFNFKLSRLDSILKSNYFNSVFFCILCFVISNSKQMEMISMMFSNLILMFKSLCLWYFSNFWRARLIWSRFPFNLFSCRLDVNAIILSFSSALFWQQILLSSRSNFCHKYF